MSTRKLNNIDAKQWWNLGVALVLLIVLVMAYYAISKEVSQRTGWTSAQVNSVAGLAVVAILMTNVAIVTVSRGIDVIVPVPS